MSDTETNAAPMRLRAEAPRVTRLSRKMLASVAAVALVGIGGALIYALQTPTGGDGGEELYSTANRQTADGLASLPRDYTGPVLGPALPGDLGGPILSAQNAGQPVVSPDAETTTPINRQPGLSLVKQAALQDTNGNGKADVGESIIFTFTLTNTGNVRLTGVTVTDPMVGDVTCARTSLAPGEQTTCRAAKPYVVTAADAEKGSVVNVATASGSAGGDQVVTSPPSSTTTPTVRPDAPKSPDPTPPKEPKVPETAGLPDAGGPAGWLLVGGLALLLGGGVLLLGVRGRLG